MNEEEKRFTRSRGVAEKKKRSRMVRPSKGGGHIRERARRIIAENEREAKRLQKAAQPHVDAYRAFIKKYIPVALPYAVFPEAARDHIKKLEQENRRLRGLLEARIEKLCQAIEKAVLKGLEIDKDRKDWDSENS